MVMVIYIYQPESFFCNTYIYIEIFEIINISHHRGNELSPVFYSSEGLTNALLRGHNFPANCQLHGKILIFSMEKICHR